MGKALSNLESRPTPADRLQDKLLSPTKASCPDVVAVQSDTTSQISNSTSSVLSTDESDTKTPINDQNTLALFRKRNYKVCLYVRIHHPSLHSVISRLIPALVQTYSVDRFSIRP